MYSTPYSIPYAGRLLLVSVTQIIDFTDWYFVQFSSLESSKNLAVGQRGRPYCSSLGHLGKFSHHYKEKNINLVIYLIKEAGTINIYGTFENELNICIITTSKFNPPLHEEECS